MTDGSEPVLEGDNLARLQRLADTLNEVVKQLAAVAETGRKTRRLTIGLTVSFALDMILTIVVTLLTFFSLNQGSQLHASQLAACAIGNQGKVEQQQLWGYLFQLSGGARTNAQKQFLTFVDKTFEPVNCAQLYK